MIITKKSFVCSTYRLRKTSKLNQLFLIATTLRSLNVEDNYHLYLTCSPIQVRHGGFDSAISLCSLALAIRLSLGS